MLLFSIIKFKEEKDGMNTKELNYSVRENGIYIKDFVNIKLK